MSTPDAILATAHQSGRLDRTHLAPLAAHPRPNVRAALLAFLQSPEGQRDMQRSGQTTRGHTPEQIADRLMEEIPWPQ